MSIQKEAAKPDSQLRRSQRLSTTEGVFSQLYSMLAAVGGIMVTRFAVLLNATPLHFSLLTAISQFSQLFSPLGVVLTRHSTRVKPPCLLWTAIGRLVSVGLCAALFLPPRLAMLVFLGVLLISAVTQSIGGNMWIAWISHSIPMRYRGRFFSYRSQVIMGVSILAGFIFSLFIDLFDPKSGSPAAWLLARMQQPEFFSTANLGYALGGMVLVGSAIGLFGLTILARQPEVPKKPDIAPIRGTLLAPLKDGNFRKLLLFQVWWMFVIGIGSPFWSPFMIKYLNMSLFSIQLYGTISTLFSIFSLRFWGRFIDRFGNKTAMKIAVFMAGVNPMYWVFLNPGHYHLIWLEAATSGMAWAGANVVATNFTLSIAPKGKEQNYSGFMNLCSGSVQIVSSLISGVALTQSVHVPGLDWQPEQVIFFAGGLARWTALIPLFFVFEAGAKPLRRALRTLWREKFPRRYLKVE